MTVTVSRDPVLTQLIGELDELVSTYPDEHVLVEHVASRLREALAVGIDLPDDVTRPDVNHYVMYPLHVDPEGRFSIASAVWNVGQGTPVHGHETWGVVGIHSGAEHEVSYAKPTGAGPLAVDGVADWSPGEVTICCTTDDDVHQVSCAGDQPCVGIHVYGADIGTISRRSYDPATGSVSWFVSRWTVPGSPTDLDQESDR
jgi:3-mercaptopropionate dioxygenase